MTENTPRDVQRPSWTITSSRASQLILGTHSPIDILNVAGRVDPSNSLHFKSKSKLASHPPVSPSFGHQEFHFHPLEPHHNGTTDTLGNLRQFTLQQCTLFSFIVSNLCFSCSINALDFFFLSLVPPFVL